MRSRTASSSTAATASRASSRCAGVSATVATRLPSSTRCSPVTSRSRDVVRVSVRTSVRWAVPAPTGILPTARVSAARASGCAVSAPGTAAAGKRGSVSASRRACRWPTKRGSTTATRSWAGTAASSSAADAASSAIRTSKPSVRRSASSGDPATGGPVRMAVDSRTHSLDADKAARTVRDRSAFDTNYPGSGRGTPGARWAGVARRQRLSDRRMRRFTAHSPLDRVTDGCACRDHHGGSGGP